MKSGSRLERILESGAFAVTAELGPPKGPEMAVVATKMGLLDGVCDAVNITDNQTAIVRLSSVATCAVLCNKGMEPVMQMTCRDRNRLAIQADLFGAVALGVRNLLCLTGDHQCFGNHPTAKNVYDLDSIQLIRMVAQMRDAGVTAGGEAIDGAMPLFIGGAANPFGDPFAFRVTRLAKKVAAGADFIQTQCIFDMPRFREFMRQVVDLGLHEKTHIMAGVMPLKSAGAARYINNNVAGISVPAGIIKRMVDAGKGKKAQAEGIKLCAETIQEVREIEGVHGVHIMAVEWEEAIQEITSLAGLLPRPVLAD
ncbi:MAG: methylenetetrahydrofolate reductase [Anaerolineae bacterium]